MVYHLRLKNTAAHKCIRINSDGSLHMVLLIFFINWMFLFRIIIIIFLKYFFAIFDCILFHILHLSIKEATTLWEKDGRQARKVAELKIISHWPYVQSWKRRFATEIEFQIPIFVFFCCFKKFSHWNRNKQA